MRKERVQRRHHIHLSMDGGDGKFTYSFRSISTTRTSSLERVGEEERTRERERERIPYCSPILFSLSDMQFPCLSLLLLLSLHLFPLIRSFSILSNSFVNSLVVMETMEGETTDVALKNREKERGGGREAEALIFQLRGFAFVIFPFGSELSALENGILTSSFLPLDG